MRLVLRGLVNMFKTSSGPDLGTLPVTSDLRDLSPSLAPLGIALPGNRGLREVVFNALGDAHVETRDAMSTVGILAGSFAGLTLVRRSKSATRRA